MLHVGRDRAPDLRLHCIQARAEKALAAHVLFDPFEGEFDLSSVLVERGNRQHG